MAGLNLTTLDKEVAIALDGERIKNLTVAELGVFMIGLIHKTYINLGWKVDERSIDLTIDELVEDLQKYNGTLTLAEIQLAFKNGSKKEYGDFFGLGNVTYFQWINSYTFGERRTRVIKTLLEAKEKEGKEPEKKSPEEIDYIMQDACLKAFDDFRRGAVVFDGGNVKYNYLVKIGVLNFTNERKMEIQRAARERLKQEALETKSNVETIKKSLSRILPETLISESKKDCLKAFFKDLTETEAELKDLFD